MKKIIQLFVLINTVLMYSQTIKINLKQPTNNKISLNIYSNKQLILDYRELYANDLMYQVSTLGIAKNQLTVFLYDFDGKLVESGIASRPLGKTDILPDEYDRLRKINEIKKLKSRIIIPSNRFTVIDFDFRIFKNVEEVFKKYPCEMFDCWYDFYTLKKGQKYKMQIQLKVRSKIFKSNVVEFLY